MVLTLLGRTRCGGSFSGNVVSRSQRVESLHDVRAGGGMADALA